MRKCQVSFPTKDDAREEEEEEEEEGEKRRCEPTTTRESGRGGAVFARLFENRADQTTFVVEARHGTD